MWFHRAAIEADLKRGDWSELARWADGLEAATRQEPLRHTELLIRLARLAGRPPNPPTPRSGAELQSLAGEFEAFGFVRLANLSRRPVRSRGNSIGGGGTSVIPPRWRPPARPAASHASECGRGCGGRFRRCSGAAWCRRSRRSCAGSGSGRGSPAAGRRRSAARLPGRCASGAGRVGDRHGREQRLGVGVVGRGEDLLGRARTRRSGRDTSPRPGRRGSAPRARSCEMKTSVVPRSRWMSISRLMIAACTETSSAETGSSAMTRSGSPARARAMPTRCFWPPESWRGMRCGESRGSFTALEQALASRARLARRRRPARCSGRGRSRSRPNGWG